MAQAVKFQNKVKVVNNFLFIAFGRRVQTKVNVTELRVSKLYLLLPWIEQQFLSLNYPQIIPEQRDSLMYSESSGWLVQTDRWSPFQSI